ncbi:MAG: right-handed parallel beta-helix repeat-containing protein [Planctomycetota bacterium]
MKDYCLGAGAYAYNSEPTIVNCLFKWNFCSDGKPSTRYGNAIYVGNIGLPCEGATIDKPNPMIKNNIFFNNISNVSGFGTVAFVGCGVNAVLEGNTFEGNRAVISGVYVKNSDGCTIDRNVFNNQFTDMHQRNLCEFWDIDKVSFTNNMIVQDQYGYGQHQDITGVYIDGFDEAVIQNNTFTGLKSETGESSCLYLTYISSRAGKASITNNIFYGSTDYQIELDLYDFPAERTKVYNNCIKGMMAGIKTNFTYYDFVGNIDVYPQFRNEADEDYRLSRWSPCINAGTVTNGITSRDFEGDPRVYDGAVDIGADEWIGSMIEAVKELCDARVYRPFKNAEITEDYSDHDQTL